MRNSSALSDIEFELMLFFWVLENPVTFAEILRFCNEEKKWACAQKGAVGKYISQIFFDSPTLLRASFNLQCRQAQLLHQMVLLL